MSANRATGKVAGAAVRAGRALLRDGPGMAGVGLAAYGAWLAWSPAGFMVAGALLIGGSVLREIGDARPVATQAPEHDA